MRFFDFGQSAHGVIAIGQEAVGVIAIGQTAVGVVAVGQMARGVFVLGQLAVGVVAVGQLAVGLWWAAGMVALAGRKVRGIGIAMFPAKDGGAAVLPKTVPLADVTVDEPGWLSVRVEQESNAPLTVVHDGDPLVVERGEKVESILRKLAHSEWPRARIRVRREHRADAAAVGGGYRQNVPSVGVLVADRIIAEPVPVVRTSAFWALLGLRTAGVAVILTIATVVAFLPMWNGIVPKALMVPWVSW